MIRLELNDSHDFSALLSREWLDTNSKGSYSSSTLFDCPTRRYHGLLVSHDGHLPDKHVFLAKVESSLTLRQQSFDFFCNKHPDGKFYPEGFNHFEEFTYDLYPSVVYRVGSARLERSLQLIHDKDVVLLRYRLLEGDNAHLVLKPLLAFRSFHHLGHESLRLQVKTYFVDNAWTMHPYPELPPLFVTCTDPADFYPGPHWVKRVEYPVEQQRGFGYQEDLFSPGIYELPIKPGQELIFAFGLELLPQADIAAAWKKEEDRRRKLMQRFESQGSPRAELKYEAEKFLVNRADGSLSIVAGYPWFAEWGRDAMIAAPGLTLHRGEDDKLVDIATTFLMQARQGLVPNYLGTGSSGASYNSVDAVLWLFAALQEYWTKTKNAARLEPLQPQLEKILLDLAQGDVTYVDDEGLLSAGSPSTQLTWMDANVHGVPVTPRFGQAVEVNALWFNALGFVADLDRALKKPVHEKITTWLEKFPAAFRRRFWIEERGYLADVVNDEGRDASLRPNQIFAVSLPLSPLSPKEMRAVVDKVTSQLLTPAGLRTLAPSDPRFVPFYTGGSDERDRSYHQGTVWPWLSFHYARAYLRVADNRQEAKAFLRRNLDFLWTRHREDAGIGGVSEIFDACHPYQPDGCIFQAWSHAEVLRLLDLLEDT